MNPAYVEQLARETVRELNQHGSQVSLRVVQHDELQATGLNLLVAVGQGAVCPPRMVLLEYTPAQVSSPEVQKVALVGYVCRPIHLNFKFSRHTLKP